MSLPALLEGIEIPPAVGAAIIDLKARKAATSEFDQGERLAVLDAFCKERIAWGRAHMPKTAPRVDPALSDAAAVMFQASVFQRGMPE
jgi:hypothetical protein